ncbi:LytTR family DNA-binding domain-containing protein [Pedobacter sp. Du54]|uniref:LytR/AlgR family response regulator transcription factor n=1 Tax=Pedobacter anseongensis TaxID=3133439 RepID=UPI0030988E12
MYSCIIIDDQAHAIQGLTQYIESVPELNLIKAYTDPLVALREIDSLGVIDVLFLDVDMPMINGIELGREIRKKVKKLVYTTGYTKYAFEAFELDADGYLLKPFSLGKFILLVNKIFPEQRGVNAGFLSEIPKQKDFFFVKSKEEELQVVKVNFKDIVAVEGQRNYVLIHTLAKKIMTRISLGEMVKLLADYPGFLQVHRSYLVNQRQIEVVDGNTVKLSNGTKIVVGNAFRDQFTSFIVEWSLKAGKQL